MHKYEAVPKIGRENPDVPTTIQELHMCARVQWGPSKGCGRTVYSPHLFSILLGHLVLRIHFNHLHHTMLSLVVRVLRPSRVRVSSRAALNVPGESEHGTST
jgi:hypothetical protein